MFRRPPKPPGSGFDAGSPGQPGGGGAGAEQQAARALGGAGVAAAIRAAQQAQQQLPQQQPAPDQLHPGTRRRSSDPAGQLPPLSLAPRSRVASQVSQAQAQQQQQQQQKQEQQQQEQPQQQQQVPAAGAPDAAGPRQPPARPRAAPGAVAAGAASRTPGMFSVFTNPLSSPPGVSSDGQPAADAPAAAALQQDGAAAAAAAAAVPDPPPAASCQQQRFGPGEPAPAAGKLAAAAPGSRPRLHFEVAAEAEAAAEAAQQVPCDSAVDYAGHDQQQQLAGEAPPAQSYVYDQDTGQLLRVGEGCDATRLGRHYLEDWNTGDFFQLAQQQPACCGCCAWLRRRPALGPPGAWFRGAGGDQASAARSLAEFTDAVSSGMAALGLFAQGLAGGLGLLCLFMSYVRFIAAGQDGFLAAYSPQAQMLNRAYFSLVSVSLVAASSRYAYDALAGARPRPRRLGVVDGCTMALYLLAHVCNLLATPLDDALAYEAARDPGFYREPLPGAIASRLGVWHGVNLVRVCACGLAWLLVCYRSRQAAMLAAAEARRGDRAAADGGGGGGGSQAVAAGATGLTGAAPAARGGLHQAAAPRAAGWFLGTAASEGPAGDGGSGSGAGGGAGYWRGTSGGGSDCGGGWPQHSQPGGAHGGAGAAS